MFSKDIQPSHNFPKICNHHINFYKPKLSLHQLQAKAQWHATILLSISAKSRIYSDAPTDHISNDSLLLRYYSMWPPEEKGRMFLHSQRTWTSNGRRFWNWFSNQNRLTIHLIPRTSKMDDIPVMKSSYSCRRLEFCSASHRKYTQFSSPLLHLLIPSFSSKSMANMSEVISLLKLTMFVLVPCSMDNTIYKI